jgi:hypothetical protein
MIQRGAANQAEASDSERKGQMPSPVVAALAASLSEPLRRALGLSRAFHPTSTDGGGRGWASDRDGDFRRRKRRRAAARRRPERRDQRRGCRDGGATAARASDPTPTPTGRDVRTRSATRSLSYRRRLATRGSTERYAARANAHPGARGARFGRTRQRSLRGLRLRGRRGSSGHRLPRPRGEPWFHQPARSPGLCRHSPARAPWRAVRASQ